MQDNMVEIGYVHAILLDIANFYLFEGMGKNSRVRRIIFIESPFMPQFELHPRLRQDSFNVGRFALSQLLMMNDSQYPWFILVPRRPETTEIYQLTEADRQLLLAESCLLAETLQAVYRPDKLNIATIGNLVPQLHLHHVVRYHTDRAWPAPIWGKFPAKAFDTSSAERELARIREHLNGLLTA